MNSQSWWASKIGVAPSRPSTPPSGPPAPAYPMPAQPVSVPVRYDSASDEATRAQSQVLRDRCPDCGSGNYFAASRETKPRCFDCGYPVVQSTSGMAGMSSDAPVHRSRQVSTESNFNPQQIIGRIG